MMVYFVGIIGGVIADKFLGQKKTVLIGGFLIAIGQLTLALENITAFYGGLILIISGVGLLKPNISTMVGGLYKPGDPLRDAGFTIFYIGINIGAATAPLLVGYIGEVYGWHYGFGLAGIGMLLGQVVYIWGQKYLKSVGNFIPPVKDLGNKAANKLTKVEKDRIIVLLISFVIVMIFWAAYEQAGGLMNLYTNDKIDRTILGWEIPASVFQSVPALFVIIFGTIVASFWLKRQRKGKESASLFKMAVGMIIMGTGFLMMSGAALDTLDGTKAMLIWLILSYLLQVIAELSISPVVLSFITKLAPVKYASIMMGLYFVAAGLGNKLAGLIGEFAQNAGELEVFTGIAATCALIGFLLLIFYKKLKVLSHGAEDLVEN